MNKKEIPARPHVLCLTAHRAGCCAGGGGGPSLPLAVPQRPGHSLNPRDQAGGVWKVCTGQDRGPTPRAGPPVRPEGRAQLWLLQVRQESVILCFPPTPQVPGVTHTLLPGRRWGFHLRLITSTCLLGEWLRSKDRTGLSQECLFPGRHRG